MCFNIKLDIVKLQNEDGSFSGDIWGEIDTRYFFFSQLLFSDILFYLRVGICSSMHKVSKQKLSCRFSYIAICCLSLLHRLDKIDVEKAVTYIVSCKNMDGGFGCTPGAESHAGQSMLLI